MGIINNKFYSLNKINKIGAVYNMIIGERSNGKTYAVLKYGIEEFIKDIQAISRAADEVLIHYANQSSIVKERFNVRVWNEWMKKIEE